MRRAPERAGTPLRSPRRRRHPVPRVRAARALHAPPVLPPRPGRRRRAAGVGAASSRLTETRLSRRYGRRRRGRASLWRWSTPPPPLLLAARSPTRRCRRPSGTRAGASRSSSSPASPPPRGRRRQRRRRRPARGGGGGRRPTSGRHRRRRAASAAARSGALLLPTGSARCSARIARRRPRRPSGSSCARHARRRRRRSAGGAPAAAAPTPRVSPTAAADSAGAARGHGAPPFAEDRLLRSGAVPFSSRRRAARRRRRRRSVSDADARSWARGALRGGVQRAASALRVRVRGGVIGGAPIVQRRVAALRLAAGARATPRCPHALRAALRAASRATWVARRAPRRPSGAPSARPDGGRRRRRVRRASRPASSIGLRAERCRRRRGRARRRRRRAVVRQGGGWRRRSTWRATPYGGRAARSYSYDSYRCRRGGRRAAAAGHAAAAMEMSTSSRRARATPGGGNGARWAVRGRGGALRPRDGRPPALTPPPPGRRTTTAARGGAMLSRAACDALHAPTLDARDDGRCTCAPRAAPSSLTAPAARPARSRRRPRRAPNARRRRARGLHSSRGSAHRERPLRGRRSSATLLGGGARAAAAAGRGGGAATHGGARARARARAGPSRRSLPTCAPPSYEGSPAGRGRTCRRALLRRRDAPAGGAHFEWLRLRGRDDFVAAADPQGDSSLSPSPPSTPQAAPHGRAAVRRLYARAGAIDARSRAAHDRCRPPPRRRPRARSVLTLPRWTSRTRAKPSSSAPRRAADRPSSSRHAAQIAKVTHASVAQLVGADALALDACTFADRPELCASAAAPLLAAALAPPSSAATPTPPPRSPRSSPPPASRRGRTSWRRDDARRSPRHAPSELALGSSAARRRATSSASPAAPSGAHQSSRAKRARRVVRGATAPAAVAARKDGAIGVNAEALREGHPDAPLTLALLRLLAACAHLMEAPPPRGWSAADAAAGVRRRVGRREGRVDARAALSDAALRPRRDRAVGAGGPAAPQGALATRGRLRLALAARGSRRLVG